MLKCVIYRLLFFFNKFFKIKRKCYVIDLLRGISLVKLKLNFEEKWEEEDDVVWK